MTMPDEIQPEWLRADRSMIERLKCLADAMRFPADRAFLLEVVERLESDATRRD